MMNNKRMVGGIAVALLLSVSSVVRADISSDFAKAKEAINNNIGAIERDAGKVLGEFKNIYAQINKENPNFEALRPYIEKGPDYANAVLSNIPKIQEALNNVVAQIGAQIPGKIDKELEAVSGALEKLGRLQAITVAPLTEAQVNTAIDFLKNNKRVFDAVKERVRAMGVEKLANVDFKAAFNKVLNRIEVMYNKFQANGVNDPSILKDAQAVARYLQGNQFQTVLNQIFGSVDLGVAYILALNSAQNNMLPAGVVAQLDRVNAQLESAKARVNGFVSALNEQL